MIYFICKYLEDDLTAKRVPNTFGGWRLGKELKLKEKEDEIARLDKKIEIVFVSCEDEIIDYINRIKIENGIDFIKVKFN